MADTTVEYNGKDFSNSTVFASADIDWYYADYISISSTASAIDVGTYTFTASLTNAATADGFKWLDDTTSDKTFKLTINKKKIGMYAPSVTDEGDLLTGYDYQIFTPGVPYEHDIDRTGATPVYKNTAPTFALEYKKAGTNAWTTAKPTTAGDYVARPYVTNPTTSHYEIDYDANNCETPFTRLKNPVAVPYFTNSSVSAADINGTVTTVQYTGDWQDFDLINDPTTGTLIGVTTGGRTGGLSYSTLTGKYRARNVGEYTVTSYLSDNGSNTRWADSTSNSATTRVTTLKITKRELKVTFADDTITSWNNGDRTDIKINVTGVIPGENVKLHVYYKDEAGNMTDVPESAMVASGTDIDVTVDVTTLAADQRYELCVELKSGVSANVNYTIKPSEAEFAFFILKATISELDIAWK
ncbi:MAG: hypothetical protein K2N74_04105, partial [Clostridiales bacterium]|nr:hypothetical protein [Clostridiales bacterium]